jgi:bifunctional non-homologous end joining protein LigD
MPHLDEPRGERDAARTPVPDGWTPLPKGLQPMLATSGALPVDDGAWAYEVKWDGVRALVAVDAGRLTVTSRNGNDVTSSYPELAALGRQLGSTSAVLDGEVVAFDDRGRTDFGRLQSRMHVASPTAALRRDTPVQLLLFDVLHLDGASLLDRTYDDRRAVLEGLDLRGDHWSVPPAFLGGGAAVLSATRAQGLEGVVAKRRASPYLPGRRSDHWLKLKHVHRTSAVVAGWKPGEGGRAGRIGSLLLGQHGPEGLEFVGHVGTGFRSATLAMLGQRLEPLRRDTTPYATPVPPEHARTAVWVEPQVVVEVEYTEWTRDGRLRHPSYKGLRDDVPAEEVVREGARVTAEDGPTGGVRG